MSSLFGKTPEVAKPAVIPDQDDTASLRAKRAAAQQRSQGRSSTRIAESGTLGGKEYSRGTLG